MEEDHVLPDFRDIESKLGRKVPEILIQSLIEGFQKTKDERKPADPVKQANPGDLQRLESKMLLLKQEMVSFGHATPRSLRTPRSNRSGRCSHSCQLFVLWVKLQTFHAGNVSRPSVFTPIIA